MSRDHGYLLPGSHGRLFQRLKSWDVRPNNGFLDPVEWIIERLEEGCFIVAFDGCGDYVYTSSEWRELRNLILERDNYCCMYCGDVATCADHVLPKVWGGLTVERNLVAACKPCNSRKGGRL